MSWRRFFQREKWDQERARELEAHLEIETQDNIARGMAPEEARYVARRKLGNVTQIREEIRRMNTIGFLETLWQDVRYALRMLGKSPGFTAVAVLTLALGIGANTAIFSMVSWLFLRPLPVEKPEQITFVAFPTGPQTFDELFSYAEYREIREGSGRAFSETAGIMGIGSKNGLTVDGRTQPASAVFVTGNFFSMLGLRPHLGRFLFPTEGGSPGANPVAVLSYRYWHTRFQSDPSVVGKKAAINGHAVTIVGVGPERFFGITPIVESEVYLPLGMAVVQGEDSAEFLTKPTSRAMIAIGRLQPGMSAGQAAALLRGLGEGLLKEYARPRVGNTLMVKPLRPPGLWNGPDLRPRLTALFLTLAALILLLASVNVGNVLLVRATARWQEMAIRSALGAGRGRLMRQLLTESLLLAILGCAAGLGLGALATAALRAMPIPTEDTIVLDFRFDWRVFAFACAAAVMMGACMGFAPMLQAGRARIAESLKEGRGPGRGKQRLRRALVAVQVGVTLPLLVAAGLFLRSLLGAMKSDLGFDPRNVVNLTMDPHEIGYSPEQGRSFYRALVERVRAIPGVTAAAVTSGAPLSESIFTPRVNVPGYQEPQGASEPNPTLAMVSPGYFKTMGIPFLRGRDFSGGDGPKTRRVAVVNQAMAARYWPRQDPIGRQFRLSWAPEVEIEIVGLVKNSRVVDVFGPMQPGFYLPLEQEYNAQATLQVRTAMPPERILPETLRTIESLAPTMPVYGVRTMTRALHGFNGLFLPELAAVLVAIMGLLGLTLAVVGVYGVVAYATGQRTREIGIRMALGAPPRAVLRMVFGQSAWIIGAGVVVGCGAALAMGTLIGDFLVEVKATDPLTYGGVALLIVFTALAACWIPARRAARVDPMVALRYE